MSPNGHRKVILEEIVDDEPPSPPSPAEGDKGLSLTLYNSASPKFSRSRGWKPRKGGSSYSKQLNLCWKDEVPDLNKHLVDEQRESDKVDLNIDLNEEQGEQMKEDVEQGEQMMEDVEQGENMMEDVEQGENMMEDVEEYTVEFDNTAIDEWDVLEEPM
ncbi:hypothetical protein L2E82_16397 [Cichorium intybus]|uniref:Uncharacterized protein n=1 Tax=Cichorium intybus TaxID=13427 RepID=A0ACB9F4R9_CICIN|nr:hypothetical protein L2E82_16397 [Cichorium intybus]